MGRTLNPIQGGGLNWYGLAVIAAVATVGGSLGALALRDFESSFRSDGAATCKVAELRAAAAARDSLAERLDAVQRQTAIDIAKLEADHQSRLAAIAKADAAKRPASCAVKLDNARGIK